MTIPECKTALYHARHNIIQRCTNPNRPDWHNYGGRGITVCDRWLNSYEAFKADVGPRPSPLHSIDRWPDVNGNYEPGNVRWATLAQQSRNRRNNHNLLIDGKPINARDASLKYGIHYQTLVSRIKRGLTGKAAVAPDAYVYRAPGEKAARATLSNAQAAAIRRLKDAGRTQTDIAREFGVSTSVVNSIVQGRTYRSAP